MFIKRINLYIVPIVLGIGVFIFLSELPLVSKFRHSLKRLTTKTEQKVFALQGKQSETISIHGKVIINQPNEIPLKGVEVEVIDSMSGWSNLTDKEGNFVLPGLLWYPQTCFTLVVSANDYQTRKFQINSSETYPIDGILDVGKIDFNVGCPADIDGKPGRVSVSYTKYDEQNHNYYKKLFDELTIEKSSDQEKLDKINRYVASKLIVSDPDEVIEKESYTLPIQVIANGSRYCGKLARTFATLAESAGYKTRVIDLIDAYPFSASHMIAEVYYDDGWHLYDPYIGKTFIKTNGKVQSYKELRLNSDSLSSEFLLKHLPRKDNSKKIRLSDLYQLGLHHYYYIEKLSTNSKAIVP